MENPGRGLQAYVGHLTLIAYPTLKNLSKSLGFRLGVLHFFGSRNGTKSHHHMSRLYRHLEQRSFAGYKHLFSMSKTTTFRYSLSIGS